MADWATNSLHGEDRDDGSLQEMLVLGALLPRVVNCLGIVAKTGPHGKESRHMLGHLSLEEVEQFLCGKAVLDVEARGKCTACEGGYTKQYPQEW